MTPERNAGSETSPITQPGFLSRLTGVWFSPTETFKQLGLRPDIVIPLIILLVIGAIVGYVMIDRIGVQNFFSQGMRQAVDTGRMTQEQMDTQLAAMTSGRTPMIIKIGFVVSGAISNVIFAVVAAGVLRLVSMIMGIENGFKKLFSVALYTFLAVGLISSLLFVIVLYLKSPEEIDIQNLVGSNLAALLTSMLGKDGLPKIIMNLARWIDVFALWMVGLLSIGFAAVSEKLKTRTAAWVVGGIYVLVALCGSLIATVRG
jgi:hypothetical protein